MEQEIEQTQKSLQDNLQGKKTSIQANINTMGENLSKDTKALQESLKAQIKSMNADLQTLSGLSQATAEQAKLKKPFFSSNIVLALIALTLLISSICLGYVSKSKYSDITAMENKVEYLKSEGGSLNIRKCGDEKDWRWCVQIDPTVEKLLQQQIRSSTGNQLNESRSTIIADYRTASTAAQRATETVRASLTAYSGTEQNNRRIREIQQRTGDALQSSDRARQRVGQHHQATTESDFISRFIAKLGEQLKTAITEPFRAVSDWLEHRGFSKDDNRAHLAADGGGRDQKPIESPDRAIDRKTEFSRAISTEFRGINPANIFSALDKLDQRRELQRAQEQAKKMTVAMIPQAHFNNL